MSKLDVEEQARQRILSYGITDSVVLGGIRGYNLDLGNKSENDFNQWDDLIWVVTPEEFLTYVANTDPTRTVDGRATLQHGRWPFERGTHNRSKAKEFQYPAFIQAGEFTVHRFGTSQYKKGESHPVYGTCLSNSKWKGWFGINIHWADGSTTGSAGCQTIQKVYWDHFYKKVDEALAAANQKRFWYCLAEEKAV